MMTKFKAMDCPACGQFHFSKPSKYLSKEEIEEELAEYEQGKVQCDHCGWEDDGMELSPDFCSACGMTFNEAVADFKAKRAADPNYGHDKKETVLILLDYYFGPIQCDWTDEEGRQITKIPVIDSDGEAQRLNKEANALWLTLFTPTEFTEENPSGFVFDVDREKEIAPELLAIVEKLVSRLEEINDGTYVIEDRETPRLKQLIASNQISKNNNR